MDCLLVVLIILLIIFVLRQDNYINSPYTTPYMMQVVSDGPECIHQDIPLERRVTYTQT